MITVLFFILCLSGCFGRMNFDEGVQQFQVQNYRQAFIRLKPEAEKGNAFAQYAIGYMYYYGEGVVEDKQKAMYWIKLSANAHNQEAIKALEILSNGEPFVNPCPNGTCHNTK